MLTFVPHRSRRRRRLPGTRAQRRARAIAMVCIALITIGIVYLVNRLTTDSEPAPPAPTTASQSAPSR